MGVSLSDKDALNPRYMSPWKRSRLTASVTAFRYRRIRLSPFHLLPPSFRCAHAAAIPSLPKAGEQALQLLSVLGRDLQGSFFPHFRRVSGVLVNLLDSPEVSPEVCGRVLRCLGFLLKFVAKPLAADTNALRSLYAPLLGHRRDFARRMAAQSLAPAVRRMKPKAMLKHAKHLIQALAAGRAGANADADADAVASAAGKGQAREGARGAEKLCLDVLDGSSQLLFFLLKGVHGRLHSQVRGLDAVPLCQPL